MLIYKKRLFRVATIKNARWERRWGERFSADPQ
jgi:hypothetical protein